MKKKRLVFTLAAALVPYLAWSFVAMDLLAAFSDPEARACWLFVTALMSFWVFIYPGWEDPA